MKHLRWLLFNLRWICTKHWYVPEHKRLLNYSFSLDFPYTHFKEIKSRISRHLIDINIIINIFFKTHIIPYYPFIIIYLIKLAHCKLCLIKVFISSKLNKKNNHPCVGIIIVNFCKLSLIRLECLFKFEKGIIEHSSRVLSLDPANIYLFKINNRNNSPCHRSSFYIANFEHISHLFLVFLLLTLSK